MIQEIAPQAAAAVAIGSCASWGGVQSATPNPTEAVGLGEALQRAGITKADGSPLLVITLPGCPASPYNLLSTILYDLVLGQLPQLDAKGRPRFAYGRLIHDHCERRISMPDVSPSSLVMPVFVRAGVSSMSRGSSSTSPSRRS
jgi:hydrogenase small subunit